MATTTWGPQPGKNPNNIATNGTNGSQILKNIFKSMLVKYIKISKIKKPHITQVVTKLVVSTTLEIYPLLLSVEHWKSLKGFRDHIKIDSIAPDEPTNIKMVL